MAINKKALDACITGTPAERHYLCEKDFSLFFCYYFSEYIKYPFAPFHFDFFDDVKKMMNGTYREVAWIGFRECAKRQPLDANIMTPTGYKKLGDLKLGDYVIGSDGKKTQIEFMSDIIDRPIYEVQTEDGRKTQCDSEHLWTVRKMTNVKHKYETIDLEEILKRGLYYNRIDKRNGKLHKEYKFALDTVKPVDLKPKKQQLDPYLVGVILGDGHIAKNGNTTLTFHKDDEYHYRENLSKYNLSKTRFDKRNTNVGCICIKEIYNQTKELGINVNSHYKFIPDNYLYGSIEQRKAILEGLMDTDGTLCSGGASFSTVSEQLADGVVSLVRSLGGRAFKKKNNWKSGMSYRVFILFMNYTPFKLERKKIKHKMSKKTFSRIVSVKLIGNKLGRCIKVTNDDGLYVTDDYILTHNTSFAKIYLTWLIVYKKKKYLNVDSYSTTNAERILFDVILNLQTNKLIVTDFGHLYNAKRDENETTQKRVNNFVTNNGVRVEAHSTGKSVRGRLHGNQRPDFLLLDDFETNDTKDSKLTTASIIAHIDEFKSGLDSSANVLYLGNRITEHGSVATLYERAKIDHRLKVRQVDAETDGKPTWDTKYTMTDEEADEKNIDLMENKFVSLEDKKRQLGSLVYSAEMMNQPVSEKSGIFKKEMFKYISREEMERKNTRKFATIDSALSKDATSDATGVVRNYVDDQNFWHVSGKAYRINPKGLIDLIFQLYDEGMEKIGIETTTFTQAIQPFFEDECRKRKKYPHIVQLKHGGVRKETRIEALVPYYESKSIYHIEGECSELEEQEFKFPMGQHEDILDALQYQRFIAMSSSRSTKAMSSKSSYVYNPRTY